MPTYGYRCPEAHEFESIHGMGDPPPTACEVCSAAPRLYATDYGQGEQKPETPAPPATGVKASDKVTKTADAKTTKKCDSRRCKRRPPSTLPRRTLRFPGLRHAGRARA